ncbi:nucleotide sugar dehydrogenase [Jiella marina]|uniref:nucleotide sugar dehydrogenase n=1 Tax=Jiella sp. LLJ827 TaxID=2917712 RepID=UPI0021006BDE|nr:nucleotide sugar dehydrogenase [Jiella sp. LLJ827]MCQ0986292.1 nucleotide sugar dehydrogenase [Jiella sp. LLJ827]
MPDQNIHPLAEAASQFVRRVDSREAVVGIIGLGYVGLPLLLAFHQSGFRTIGFDIDPAKIEALEAGRTYIHHIPDGRVAALAASMRARFTTDFDQLGEVDAIIICVPTPLTQYRDPDMSFVERTAEAIAPHLRRGQLVTLESTTYPMTSEDLLASILERGSGLAAGRDFAIAYSPEREDPGNPDFDTNTIPKVVGADCEPAGDMAQALYATVTSRVVRVPTMRTAEAVKLTENIFRAVNIALVNELKVIFDRMGIDAFEVIDAAKTKPFGFMPFYPGPGIGGHCIPVDPFYLTWKAREFGVHTRFIELAGEINSGMPEWVVARLVEAMSDRLGKPIRGARILLVGLAYKKNVDDMRESPSLVLWELLESKGATVEYYDTYAPVVRQTRKHGPLAGRRSIEWNSETLETFDAALIATDHDGVDLEELVRKVPLVVDSRGATRSLSPELRERVVRA